MKKLQIFMMLTMVSILQNQQTFTAEQDIINVEKTETMPEAAPVAVVAEIAVPTIQAPVAETAEIVPAVATPVVVIPAEQPAIIPIKTVPGTESPAQKDLAEAKVAFKKIGGVAYNVLQRTAHDLHAVIMSAVAIVKDMSQDLSRSIHQFIAEKSEKKDGDKPEDKVVTQTYRGDNRQDNRQNNNEQQVPIYAYELINGEEVPYISGYEEVTN